MKLLGKIIIAISLFIAGQNCFSKTVSFSEENISGTISYTDTISQGDALFARMNLKLTKQAKKKGQNEVIAALQLFKNGKKIDSSQFYYLNPKAKHSANPELMTAIPISLWDDGNGEYYIKLILSSFASGDKEVTLPVNYVNKDFEKETLDLDDKNSNIRQNNSAERMAQIVKLNDILGTVMATDVYTLKPFIRPVKSERMTAHCGDRRVYKYTNGKSDTSLHYGNDYGVPEGTEVQACGDGRVVLAEFRISTGWSVVIEHLPGLYSLYYHMRELNVKENDMVKQGQKIGSSGSTGLATGPHLHWEIRLNMAAVIPEYFMKDYAFETVN